MFCCIDVYGRPEQKAAAAPHHLAAGAATAPLLVNIISRFFLVGPAAGAEVLLGEGAAQAAGAAVLLLHEARVQVGLVVGPAHLHPVYSKYIVQCTVQRSVPALGREDRLCRSQSTETPPGSATSGPAVVQG